MVNWPTFIAAIEDLAWWWTHGTVIERLKPENREGKRKITKKIWELKSSVSLWALSIVSDNSDFSEKLDLILRMLDIAQTPDDEYSFQIQKLIKTDVTKLRELVENMERQLEEVKWQNISWA